MTLLFLNIIIIAVLVFIYNRWKNKNSNVLLNIVQVEIKDGIMKINGLTIYLNDILGYGSHGTVVYRGENGGRKVAVKRMLNTFYSSAEREMDLLIRSDGNSNVVRYYTQEKYGDFIYLALELCDGTLVDIIHENNDNNMLSNVNKSKKFLLVFLYIIQLLLNGIQHIHSLFIVHRDLKPQNILIQKISEDIKNSDNIFDNYVPKISDMGLSKKVYF